MKEKPIFTYESSSGSSRHAYRARVPGLVARDCATQALYPVNDISAGGMSLEDEAGSLKAGDVLSMDVLLKDHVILTGLAAEVARRHETVAGLKFTDLTRRQEERLDKLVLEVQKYLISKSKLHGSRFDDEHKT
jgi:hypothetical protein